MQTGEPAQTARGKGNKELMTPNLAIEKLAAAIDATTVTWRNGTVMQGQFVELKRKDAIALLQLLRPEDKAAPACLTPAFASLHEDQPAQVAGAIVQASI